MYFGVFKLKPNKLKGTLDFFQWKDVKSWIGWKPYKNIFGGGYNVHGHILSVKVKAVCKDFSELCAW